MAASCGALAGERFGELVQRGEVDACGDARQLVDRATGLVDQFPLLGFEVDFRWPDRRLVVEAGAAGLGPIDSNRVAMFCDSIDLFDRRAPTSDCS